jgi:hypothetical protein
MNDLFENFVNRLEKIAYGDAIEHQRLSNITSLGIKCDFLQKKRN